MFTCHSFFINIIYNFVSTAHIHLFQASLYSLEANESFDTFKKIVRCTVCELE